LNDNDYQKIIKHIRSLIDKDEYYLTQHAHTEMYEDLFTINDVLIGIKNGEIIEHYPDHKRGPCCLINGKTLNNRSIHIVTTTMQNRLIIITVYEPKSPKWISPIRRGS
jgi:hypothetical protein